MASTSRQPDHNPATGQPTGLIGAAHRPPPLQLFASSWGMMTPVGGLTRGIMFSPLPHERILHILRHFPDQGSDGTKLTVELRFLSQVGRRLRIAVGRRAVTTEVRSLGDGGWALEAAVPPLPAADGLVFQARTMPLTVQALDDNDFVVDSITFGQFTYMDSTPLISAAAMVVSPRPRVLKRSSSSESKLLVPEPSSPSKRGRFTELPQTPSPTLPTPDLSPPAPIADGAPSPTTPSTPATPLRQDRADVGKVDRRTTFKRTKRAGADSQRAAIRIISPLHPMTADWSERELAAGRRLVRFRRVLELNEILVYAQPITQAEYDAYEYDHAEDDALVISCIMREQAAGYCVTSVDIICLLQMLEGADFGVEEKNRIRRNLEGLKPTTIAKTKSGCEVFFQRIMDYPKPRPRHIEKDIKVFDWAVLGQALDKIISKKSIFTSRPKSSPSVDAPAASAEPVSEGASTPAEPAFEGTSTPALVPNTPIKAEGGTDVYMSMHSPLDGHVDDAELGGYYSMLRHHVPSPLALYSPLLASGPRLNTHFRYTCDATFNDLSTGRPYLSPVACAPVDLTERASSQGSDGEEVSPNTDVDTFNLLGLSGVVGQLDDELSFLSSQYLTFD